MLTAEDIATIKAEFLAMSPEQRKQMVNQLCDSVDQMAKSIVKNKDAIWEAHAGQPLRA